MANTREKKKSGTAHNDVSSSFGSTSYTISTIYINGDRALGNSTLRNSFKLVLKQQSKTGASNSFIEKQSVEALKKAVIYHL